MIKSKSFKGIEYVQFTELPIEQQVKIKETLNKDCFIKILINGKVVSDCIQFKDYCSWFNTIYKISEVEVKDPSSKEDVLQLEPI